jgi:hypothetical protein
MDGVDPDKTGLLGDWCTGDLVGKSSEMDWLRFWWDFLTEEPATVDFADCVEIYGDATAEVGPAWSSDWDPTPGTSTPWFDQPPLRFASVAAALGLAVEWDAHLDNGTDR